MEIAVTSGHENRRAVLMQFYDEIARKEWAERALRGDPGFCVNKVCNCASHASKLDTGHYALQASMRLDSELLSRARHAYDRAMKVEPAQQNASSGGGGGKSHRAMFVQSIMSSCADSCRQVQESR